LQEPVARTLLARLGGADVLGAFSVSWKIPQTSSAAVSEGLRPLLPGLSDLLRAGETDRVANLIGQSLFLQLVLSVPISLFLWIYAAPIFQVWLGLSEPALVQVTRVIIIGYAAINLTVPFFWSLQAYGQASTIAWLTACNICIVVLVCAPALLFLENALLVCAVGMTLAQVVFAFSAHTISQSRWGLVTASYRNVSWMIVIALNGPVLAYNIILNAVWGPTAAPVYLLALAVAGSAALYGAVLAIILCMRRHHMRLTIGQREGSNETTDH
jgi:O-antigen/teichoic acid export membrane protein